MKKNHKKLINSSTNQNTKSNKIVNTQTIRTLLIKFAVFAVIVFCVIWYTDVKGYFNSDNSNNHIQKKWDVFYKMTSKTEIDIILLGNSHMYTGINPENLSNALGLTSYIISSPGTTITDSYYTLKEVLTLCKPKIAVLETFTIFDYDSRKAKPEAVLNQIKSFSGRKNFNQKLRYTPVLFPSDYYVSAWSNTIRNHSFIFTDQDQIRTNKILSKRKKVEDDKLYLGRFIRFTSGMEDSSLAKIAKPEFKPYDYNKTTIGKEAKKYLHKIIKLCKDNNIELVLLSIPVYNDIIQNWGPYKEAISQEINPYHIKWLDLQEPYDVEAFTPECFENTTETYQHTTYYGSLVASYKLADFIAEEFGDKIPDRSNELFWKQTFYNSDGYFYNHSPESNDLYNKILLKDVKFDQNLHILEIDFIHQNNNKVLMVKIDKTNIPDIRRKKITLVIQGEINGQKIVSTIELTNSHAIDPYRHYLFISTPLNNNLEIDQITNIQML